MSNSDIVVIEDDVETPAPATKRAKVPLEIDITTNTATPGSKHQKVIKNPAIKEETTADGQASTAKEKKNRDTPSQKASYRRFQDALKRGKIPGDVDVQAIWDDVGHFPHALLRILEPWCRARAMTFDTSNPRTRRTLVPEFPDKKSNKRVRRSPEPEVSDKKSNKRVRQSLEPDDDIRSVGRNLRELAEHLLIVSSSQLNLTPAF